jgi:Acetyl-CoA acetyltransferase
MNQKTAIVGVGETTYSSNSGMTTTEILLQASYRAVHDAGLSMSDIDGVVLPRIRTDLHINEFEFFTHANFKYRAIAGMDAGAGVVNSMELAQMALQTGQANYVLLYIGANQVSEKATSSPRGIHQEDLYKRNCEIPFGYFPQPVYFGSIATRYQQLYGNIEEQQAVLAVNTRKHAILNGNAQMTKPMTREDYFRSPLLADPLRLFDCCVMTDGAAAMIMTTEERAKDLPRPAVSILGMATAGLNPASPFFFTQTPDPLTTSAVITAPIAFAQAGVSREDIDVLEIYDSFTINVILQLEDLGFCPKGEGARFIGNGETISLDGKLPLNTHGGLLSQGYMYGMAHVIEAVKQLRGEAGRAQVKDAEVSLVSGFGGWYQGTLILGGK